MEIMNLLLVANNSVTRRRMEDGAQKAFIAAFLHLVEAFKPKNIYKNRKTSQKASTDVLARACHISTKDAPFPPNEYRNLCFLPEERTKHLSVLQSRIVRFP